MIVSKTVMKLIATSHAHNLTDLNAEILDKSTSNYPFLQINQ